MEIKREFWVLLLSFLMVTFIAFEFVMPFKNGHTYDPNFVLPAVTIGLYILLGSRYTIPDTMLIGGVSLAIFYFLMIELSHIFHVTLEFQQEKLWYRIIMNLGFIFSVLFIKMSVEKLLVKMQWIRVRSRYPIIVYFTDYLREKSGF